MRDVSEYNEIPELLKQGNSARLNTLINDLRLESIRYCMRAFGASEQEAEEYTQQALLGLLEQSLKRKDGFSNTYGYALASARNAFFLRYKHQSRFCATDTFDLDVAKDGFADEPYIAKEREQIIERCINKMKPRYRKLIRLYLQLPDLHYKKAAQLLGVSPINVRTMKSRAFVKLQQAVEKVSA